MDSISLNILVAGRLELFARFLLGKALGVKDFSSFARGAVQTAIEMGRKAHDPKWQGFIEAIQPIAKKKLGYGIFHGGAWVTEGYGKERKGISAEEYRRQIGKKK